VDALIVTDDVLLGVNVRFRLRSPDVEVLEAVFDIRATCARLDFSAKSEEKLTLRTLLMPVIVASCMFDIASISLSRSCSKRITSLRLARTTNVPNEAFACMYKKLS
jgi:hypothetical protein